MSSGGLVLASVYARTRSIFGVGTWLWMSVFNTWPYSTSWALTIALILVVTVAGVLIGLVYEKVGTPKPV